MKKLILTAVALFGFLVAPLSADGYVVINGNYDYDKTETKTYKTNYCVRGYHALKKYLKDDAKQMCARRGHYGVKMLVMKKFTKISCTKIKRRHHRTKVRVKGRFRAMCKQ